MDIEVLTGPPGCGKSYDMRQEAIHNPGLYLFAYPSLRLLREQAKAFEAEIAASRPASALQIMEAHSEARGGGSVESQLDRHLAFLTRNGISHGAILITHEGMMGSDLSSFADWNVRIDEAPTTIQSGTVKAPASAALLKTAIAIQPVGSHGWGELKLLGGKKGWVALQNDDLLKPLAEMLKQASRHHGVFVDTVEWKDEFGWCSIWPLTSLDHCRSIKIAGASYPISLGALVAKRWEGAKLNFAPHAKPMVRTRQPTIRIHYFTRSHEGTTTLWRTRHGSSFIVKICDFLVAKEPKLGFWGANKEVERLLDHRLNGEPVSTKSAGINALDDRTSCALIYSSKRLPTDRPAQELFRISDAEIFRAREEEDILQFVMRGAIRRADFGDEYDVYLYSKRQAELVAEKLKASSIGQAIHLVPEPGAGIMDADPDPERTKRTALSVQKAKLRQEKEAERKRKKRAADALAAGREPHAAGRPSGSKDKQPRRARSKLTSD